MNELLDLQKLVESRDARKIAELIKLHGLTIEDSKIKIPDDKVNDLTAYWDKRQLVKKILLNSASTGALN